MKEDNERVVADGVMDVPFGTFGDALMVSMLKTKHLALLL